MDRTGIPVINKRCIWTALLHKMCQVFAVLPCESASKLYPALLIPLELSAFAYIIFERNANIISDLPSWTIQFMSLLNDISLTASLAACVIRNNFVNAPDLIAFMDKCANLQQINIRGTLVFTNLLFAFYIAFNAYNIWNAHDFWYGLVSMYRDLVSYQVLCFYLLLTYYATLLNAQMIILSDAFNARSIANAGIKTLEKDYLKLYMTVGEYSSIFGVDYVFLYLNLVINCMSPLNLLSKYSIMTDTNRSTTLIGIAVIWFLFPIIFMWIIIKPCNGVTQKALQIANKCKELEFADDVDAETKAKLNELSSKIIASPPIISAENCFPVNFGMASSILSSVATYFVVLVQFN